MQRKPSRVHKDSFPRARPSPTAASGLRWNANAACMASRTSYPGSQALERWKCMTQFNTSRSRRSRRRRTASRWGSLVAAPLKRTRASRPPITSVHSTLRVAGESTDHRRVEGGPALGSSSTRCSRCRRTDRTGGVKPSKAASSGQSGTPPSDRCDPLHRGSNTSLRASNSTHSSQSGSVTSRSFAVVHVPTNEVERVQLVVCHVAKSVRDTSTVSRRALRSGESGASALVSPGAPWCRRALRSGPDRADRMVG